MGVKRARSSGELCSRAGQRDQEPPRHVKLRQGFRGKQDKAQTSYVCVHAFALVFHEHGEGWVDTVQALASLALRSENSEGRGYWHLLYITLSSSLIIVRMLLIFIKSIV